MEKRNYKFLTVLIITITISFAIIIITLGIVFRNKNAESVRWVLHSYGNNVALYNGEEIIEVYGSITLDSLPENDRRQLDNGIAFLTREEALSAIEDFD